MRQLVFVALFAPLVVTTGIAQDRPVGAPFATRSTVIAPRAAAATSHPLATQAALEIMRAGGNAIDAAIAANAVLALAEPTGCGLGGDLFTIIWSAAEQRLLGLNGSGRSPRELTREKLLAELAEQDLDTIPPTGPLPISVPGAVDGWCTVHARLGKLPLAKVLAPAIHYAETGVPITRVIAFYWSFAPRLKDQPGFAEVFLPGGRAPREGELFKNPALARTLRRIAADGRRVFYEGEIAKELVRFVRDAGGHLTLDDLREHHAEWVEPVSVNYRGVDVWELPPNGQGIAALQILQLIEPYDIRAMGFGSTDWAHLFTEAKKLAFEDRARFYADMDFYDVPVKELLSDAYAARRRERLDMQRAARSIPSDAPTDGDTIYLTTADAEGNMVSWIQSNYRGFGSGVVPPELGFGLQDRGELFDMTEDRANSYAPGKRPFHTIIPAFATRDGEPWLAFGVMGGAMQPQGHAQIIVNLVDFGMDLQEAGDAPRLRHTGSSQPTGERMTDGGALALELGYPDAVLDELRRRGHQVERGGSYGGYQAILRDPDSGLLHAASESRKDGHAAGF